MTASDAVEATRDGTATSPEEAAARALAALTGLHMQHFSYRGRPPDRAFGGAALADRCEIVDVFGPLGPGTGPHAGAKELHRRIHRHWRHKTWIAHYKALNAAFLAHEGDRRIHSPLSGEEATILGSVAHAQYQFTPCLDPRPGGDALIVLISIGYMPVGLYHPAENLFLVLTSYVLHMPAVLRAFLDGFTARPVAWLGWLRRAMAGELRRAYLLGDNRPSHFVRQSLAYVDSEEAALLDFARGGGLLVAMPDLCAMDPFALFPALAAFGHRAIRSDAVTGAILAEGLDAHRVYRHNIHPDAAWLRRRLRVEDLLGPAAGRFRVMISLDAERERVINAVDAFRFLLRKIGEACDAAGLALDVVWDGWTLPAEPGTRDREVIARIEAMAAAITGGLDRPPDDVVRLYDRSSLDKVADLARCDLAVTTQGTGAQIASWLLRRPTIVYHVAGATSNRSYLDDATAVDMDPRAVDEVPRDDPRSGGHERFFLARWGLEDALRRAVGDRLPIRAECPPPG